MVNKNYPCLAHKTQPKVGHLSRIHDGNTPWTIKKNQLIFVCSFVKMNRF